MIDKQTEKWKIQPWWFRWGFWTVDSRQFQLKVEKYTLFLGIMLWLAGLTIWFISGAGVTGSEIGKAGLAFTLLTGPLCILWAYFTGWIIRHGDKEQLW